MARQYHFNYTTPDRSRQEMLSVMTPRPINRWPFIRYMFCFKFEHFRKEHQTTCLALNKHFVVLINSKGDGGNPTIMPSPHTPKAPKHAPRPPCRAKLTEMKQISAVLFQDQPTFPSRCSVPSVLQRSSLFKPMPPKHPRVLFYEEELCHAVAQNNLS